MSREFARRLRANMTDAERFVWQRLKHRQLGGFKFRRQAPIGPYIADFACFDARLVIELDGGQHAENASADAARTRWLEGEGFRVVRFWNHDALRDWDAIEEHLWQLLTGGAPTPHPNPPPQGGREQEVAEG